MELTQLIYFKTLAEAQHMTRAAEALHVSQPALSRTLRSLEEELGLLLFDRVGKNIRLNENGRVLLRHVNTALAAIEDAKTDLSHMRGDENRMVSLSMRAGSKLLPDIIRGFKARYPQIAIQIMQEQPDAGELPCDITIYSAMMPADGPCERTLLREEICLALPVENALSMRDSVRLEEVADEPFICLYKGKGLREATDAYCREAGFAPNIVLESDNPATVRELIAVGVGLAFIPKVTWRGMDRDPGVRLVEISAPACARYINMSWRDRRYQSEAVSKLKDYLVEFFVTLAE